MGVHWGLEDAILSLSYERMANLLILIENDCCDQNVDWKGFCFPPYH